MQQYFYYTRWKFISIPPDLDSVGPYHSTWVTEQNPKEFFAGILADNTAEFFVKVFPDEEAMRAYAKTVGL